MQSPMFVARSQDQVSSKVCFLNKCFFYISRGTKEVLITKARGYVQLNQSLSCLSCQLQYLNRTKFVLQLFTAAYWKNPILRGFVSTVKLCRNVQVVETVFGICNRNGKKCHNILDSKKYLKTRSIIRFSFSTTLNSERCVS